MSELQSKLVEMGYKSYTEISAREYADLLFQKVVKDSEGNELYHLNAYYYAEKPTSYKVLPEMLEWEVQFYLNENEYFDVTFHTKDIEKAEKFFHDTFHNMGCVGVYNWF